MTANPLTSSSSGSFSNSRSTLIFFLAFSGLVEGLVTVCSGGPVAQASGDMRTWSLICCALAGLLGAAYWAVIRPSFDFESRLEQLAVLVPVYAFLQVVPLPIKLVRILSPARASLADALQSVTAVPRWIPLSAVPSATLYHCLLFSACTAVFLVTYDLARRLRPRSWIVAIPLVVVGVAEAVIGRLQASASPDGIATGTFLIRNHYAGFLEMILPFCALIPFAHVVTPEPGTSGEVHSPRLAAVLQRCAGIALAALLFAAIVSSLSRMGFVAALISMALVTIAAFSRSIPRRGIPLVAAAVVVAAVLLAVLLPSGLVARFSDLEESGNDRSPAWHDTLGLVRAYPVFGCGLGAYESTFLQFKTSYPALDQDYAHNDFLQYFAEMGAVGFAILILPLSAILIRLRVGIMHNRPDIRWLSLACAGSALAIGLHSVVDFNFYVPANLFTFAWILGIAASIGQQARRPETTQFQPRSGFSHL